MIEVIVVSKNPLVSVAKWQQEIDRAGFGLALETPIPIESLDGFVSAKWTSGALNYSNRPGFECRYLDLTTAQQIDGLSSLLDSHSVIFTLGWVEHPFDRIAVQIAALAYAIGTDGTIFLPCKGVSTPDALLRELKAEDKYGYTSPSLVTGHGPRWKGEDIYRYNERPKTLIKNSAGTELHKLKRAHYAVLVGRNNSGKSFALKALTAHWGKRAAYLGPARYQNFNLLPHFTPTETKDQRWQHFSNEWANQTLNVDNSPLSVQQAIAELTDEQRTKLREIVKLLLNVDLEFRFTVAQNEMSQKYVSCNGHNISYTSSGLRLVVTIITSLLDDSYDIVLIDEPELGISPEAQGTLADFLGNDALRSRYFPHIKTLILATHSTIFLDRSTIRNNYIVEKTGNDITINQISTQRDFNGLHFWLLGNRFETLYLPSSILFVEGKSDHKFIERLLSIRYPNHRLSIIATNSDSQIKHYLHITRGVLNELQKSPYHDRIFVVLDSVNSSPGLANEIVRMGIPEQNVIKWSANGIEFLYPEQLMDQLFGKGSSVEVRDDTVFKNDIKLSKTELSEKIVAMLHRDTPIHSELMEKLVSKLDKVLT